MKKRPIICAYYFPNWHVDPRNEALHGKDWTEWRVVQCATPRFPGHEQPKIPLWGYRDEDDPAVMAQKIKAASEHGIDAFVFDWYFFQDGPYRERCLENGFLRAPNTGDLKFAIMWANHDPVYSHPRAYRKPQDHVPWSGKITPETFVKCADYCIEKFFGRANYLRVDGALYFDIYRPESFAEDVGGADAAAALIRDFRGRAEKAGLGELRISANTGGLSWWDGGFEKVNELCKKIGFDTISSYGGCPSPKKFPSVDYLEWCEELKERLRLMNSGFKLPYNPSVASGWDSSPRTVQSDMYENIGYPFSAVAVGSTPENFEKTLRYFYEFMVSAEASGNMLHISCWNEWTEGSCIEPDMKYKYGYLEAVKRVCGSVFAKTAGQEEEKHAFAPYN